MWNLKFCRDGDHSIVPITRRSLKTSCVEVFDQLAEQKVLLEGMLLKPSMVITGGSADQRADPEEVAEKTIGLLSNAWCRPRSQELVFLSGGEPTMVP